MQRETHAALVYLLTTPYRAIFIGLTPLLQAIRSSCST
jgi:hypothetical protein